MKIATWNVNSLSVRLPQVLEWLAAEQPDVLALQETKCADENFPVAQIEEAGYRWVCSGQKTYNGVALLSKVAGSEVVTDLPGYEDHQRRVLGATFGDVRVLNVYVPNGQSVGSEKYDYKLLWLEHLIAHVRSELEKYPRFVILGDFNIAPEDRDVHDPVLWDGRVLFSAPERDALRRLLELGLCDTLRLHTQESGLYSWWDYRMYAFRRNMGLRIDHIFASRALCAASTACRIDVAPRRAQRPSDHAPVVAEFRDVT